MTTELTTPSVPVPPCFKRRGGRLHLIHFLSSPDVSQHLPDRSPSNEVVPFGALGQIGEAQCSIRLLLLSVICCGCRGKGQGPSDVLARILCLVVLKLLFSCLPCSGDLRKPQRQTGGRRHHPHDFEKTHRGKCQPPRGAEPGVKGSDAVLTSKPYAVTI